MPNWFMVDAQMPNAGVFHSAFFTLHSALNWSPRLVSRQRLLLFREALICLSYSGHLNEERGMKNREWNPRPGQEHPSCVRSVLCILHSAFEWSSRQVMLLRLPVISRGLCY